MNPAVPPQIDLQKLEVPRLIFAYRVHDFYTLRLYQPPQKRTLFFDGNIRRTLNFPPMILGCEFLAEVDNTGQSDIVLSNNILAFFTSEENPKNLRPETPLYYPPLPNFVNNSCCLGLKNRRVATIEQGVKVLLNRFYSSEFAREPEKGYIYPLYQDWLKKSERNSPWWQYQLFAYKNQFATLRQILPTRPLPADRNYRVELMQDYFQNEP